mgnify:FL=1
MFLSTRRRFILSIPACMLAMAMAMIATALGAEFIGVVYPKRDLALGLETAGVVVKVNVEAGERVKQGDVLIALDDRLRRIESERRQLI